MPHRRLGVACLVAVTLVLPLGCSSDPGTRGDDPALASSGSLEREVLGGTTTTWSDGAGAVAPLTLVQGSVTLDHPTDEVRIDLLGARMVSIPDSCVPSTVVATASAIVGADLVCLVAPGADTVDFTAIVVGRSGDELGGQVTARRGTTTGTTPIPTRAISGPDAALEPDLRLLSSPDFLNGDIGDLADGPGLWAGMPSATRTPNSTNAAYDEALDRVLDDWQSLDPAGVLVAGDLVDGRWGYDDEESGNFGPVDTNAERRRALQRAARTYYPQWQQRFDDRGLSVFPAMGDHEYGDNPWPRRKRRLAADFKAEFAREFTTKASGRPLFPDHPRGPARLSAYAGRPSPDVQVVTIDVFDITPKRAKIKVDRQQMRWLRGVLERARRDGVQWVVVQGHVPVLYPVRARASSRLHYPRGSRSRLWKLFDRFDVDLYLSGEVHDTTARQARGVVQISHGGIFQFSLTTALLLDFYGDRLYVTLRDYDVTHAESPDGVRLWETRRGGNPAIIEVGDEVSTIGTATIVQSDGPQGDGARLIETSGILVPPDDGG